MFYIIITTRKYIKMSTDYILEKFVAFLEVLYTIGRIVCI